MRHLVRTSIVATVVLVVAGGSVAWRLGQRKDPLADWRTALVKRGGVVAAISATGTVEPEEVVDVGAQVLGAITGLGKDDSGRQINYRSLVEEGMVLARIDDSLYVADVDTAKAAVLQAQANQVSAEANVQQMQAKLIQAEQDWNRAQKLGPSSEALAPSAYDQYQANYGVAKANAGVAKAAVEQAKAALAAAQAGLVRAQKNLQYCTITSPVKGIIIDRRVNIGQTVVSSLNAPSLFLIAKDLTRIQVWVSVNEADIGSVHQGMPATFTVDAFPGQVFHGQVGRIRLNATMTQNVVTYTVEVNTDNADSKLLPYLTANVQFITGSREDVLTVPNAALHWQPPGQEGQRAEARGLRAEAKGRAPGKAGARPGAGGQKAEGRGKKPEPGRQEPEGNGQERGTVWLAEERGLKPVQVTVGLTDGAQTEVRAADLQEGMQVVVGEKHPGAAGGPASGAASPFIPQIGRGRGGGR
ncbi:MAG TPA: efflux RND transporter periplasmic adaptor subunit [Dongiaceae bacterium]|nr:efflux RND transporter periplasmic adaptor subunit [Dongiaceae bacterium]